MLGISLDAPQANRAFAEKFGFPFRLLSDTDRKVSIAYRACETEAEAYARRITYVVGPDGRIEHGLETRSPGDQADELLRLLS